MKTVVEAFGQQWREIDVTWLSMPDKRREFAEPANHTEKLTFGMACNALINSLRRVDDVDRRHYASGRARFAPLKSGMFTLGDLATVFAEWRSGERWVGGFGPACGEMMATFFSESDTDGVDVANQQFTDELHALLRDMLSEIDRCGRNVLVPIDRVDASEYRHTIRAMLSCARAGLEALDLRGGRV